MKRFDRMERLKIMRKQTCFLGLFLLLVPSLLWALGATDYKEGGTALFRAGQYAKALDYFKNAVQADPNDAEAYADLGDTYMKMGDSQNARDAYNKSLQINPNNSNVQASLDNLGGAPASSPSAGQPGPNTNQAESDQPIQEPSRVVVRPRRAWVRPAPVDYKDGLAPMDHSKFWVKLELAYNYSLQTDLVNSANSINNGTFNPSNAVTASTTYSGSALASNSASDFGGELGFLVNPYFGVGI